MCDYSLRHLASRPAKRGDRLVLTSFGGTPTRGFAALDDSYTAVCLMPGTQIAFEADVTCERVFPFLPRRRLGAQVATFVKMPATARAMHRDALEFPDGTTVLVTRLCHGQKATVLQLPPMAAPAKEPTAAPPVSAL